MEVFGFFIVILIVSIAIRIFAGSMDEDRMRRYIRQQGGTLLSSRWTPLGRGWFGEKNDRIYEVRYRDTEGNIHKATVKTSMFSGVYFTENRIVRRVETPSEEPSDLEAENDRLRRRIAELEGEGL